MHNLEALLDALTILRDAQQRLSGEPSLHVWAFVKHAADRLDDELRRYLREQVYV